jgi:hypothetical protein
MKEKLTASKLKKLLTDEQWHELKSKVAERLSGYLKIFMCTPRRSKTAHLYGEGQSGLLWSLCRQPVDESVPASQIVKLRPGICRICAREAQQIFSRKDPA